MWFVFTVSEFMSATSNSGRSHSLNRQRFHSKDLLTRSLRQFYVLWSGPSRATAGPGKPFSQGPITISVHSESEAARGRKCGRGVPHHPTRGLGERRKLFQLVPGQSADRKWILCIFEVRKKLSGPPFSVFFERWRGPQNVAGPRKTFPLSPLDGPVCDDCFFQLIIGQVVCAKGQPKRLHQRCNPSLALSSCWRLRQFCTFQ